MKSAKAHVISALEDLGVFVKAKDGKWEDLTVNNKGNDFGNNDDQEDDEDEDNHLNTMEETKGSSEGNTLENVSDELQVDVSTMDKTVYIRKTTAIWLFQEFERVYSDCLF